MPFFGLDSLEFSDDVTAPYLQNRDPAPSAVNIALDKSIYLEVIDDDNDVDEAQTIISVRRDTGEPLLTAYDFSSGWQNGYTGSVVEDTSGAGLKYYKITVIPPTNWDVRTTITVGVVAKDILGNTLNTSYTFDVLTANVMSTAIWSFTTADPSPPFVSDREPGPGWWAVPKDYAVQFRITDAESGVDLSSLYVTLAGAVAYDGGDVGSEWQPGYTGSITDEGGGTYLVQILTHPDFASYSSVAVTVDAQNLETPPVVMPQDSWTFQSEDYVPPYVAAGWTPTGTSVPLAALITFTIKDDDSGVDLSTLQVTVGGVDAIVDGEFVAPFAGASSEITGTPASYDVVIDSDPDYNESTSYEVIVNASDSGLDGPVIPAMFDGESLPYEEFETAPSNREIPFDSGTAVSATFNDGADTEEEFENWD